MAISQLDGSSRVAVLKTRLESLTLEDLRQISLVLDVDYENLGGDTKAGKVRGLILYFQRRNELDRLEEAAFPGKPPCPYPGMAPFSAENANRFYGREREIQSVVRHFRLQPFLLVIGPSGSGKSSLLYAGVLPRLQSSDLFPPGFWLIRTMRPGNQPLQELARALGAASPGAAQPSEAISSALPLEAVNALLQANSPAQHLLLVVDQFEELFTHTTRDVQNRFIAAVKELLTLDHCAVMLAMRADFYADLISSDLWPIDPSQRFEIAPLRGLALREAIQQPAAHVGVAIEPALVERLAAADEPGALPLIQETLVLLWEQMTGRLLSLAAYEALGNNEQTGLQVAMSQRADAVMARLTPEQQAIARRIFLRLAQFGEGRPDTRRQQPIAALRADTDDPEVFGQTLDQLTESRLLFLSGTPAADDRKVDIAHEALLDGWASLRGWLNERREAEQTRRRLEAQAAEWARLGKGSGGLLDPVELAEAENWLAGRDAVELGVSPSLRELANVSRAAIEQQKRDLAAVRQRDILFNALAGGLGAALCAGLAAALAGYILWEANSEQFIHLPRAFTVFAFGLMGGLLGGVEGVATALGFTLAGISVKIPRARTWLIGGALGGGVFGALLFGLFKLAGTLPPEVPFPAVLASGFTIFGLASGAVASALHQTQLQRSLVRLVLVAAAVASAAGWLGVWLSYHLFDLTAATDFPRTALGFAALEGMAGAGMALGIGVARRLGYAFLAV